MKDTEIKDVRPTTEGPAVVVTKSGVSLADRLNLRDLPLATTPGGRVFSLKALHPSEHTIKTSRVPGGNRISVAVNCDMVSTFTLGKEGGGFVRVITAPNIAIPAMVEVQDEGNWTRYDFFNAAFGGSVQASPTFRDVGNFIKGMLGKISEYRITSQSCTVELIAPALRDQGSLVAAQYLRKPLTASLAHGDASRAYVRSDGLIYVDPIPTSTALMGTAAYTSKAREGCYLPLKLTSFKWRNFNDRAIYFNTDQTQFDATPFEHDYHYGTTLSFPYYEARNAYTDADYPLLQPIPKLCGDNFGFVILEGLGENVSVRVRVRQVIEMTVPPGSLYAPMAEAPLPPDETAIRMYFEISGRMADGYPAAYNDLGKLKDIILGLGKKILPFVEPALSALSMIPGPVGAIASGAKQIAPIVTGVVQQVKASKKKKKQPAALSVPPGHPPPKN